MEPCILNGSQTFFAAFSLQCKISREAWTEPISCRYYGFLLITSMIERQEVVRYFWFMIYIAHLSILQFCQSCWRTILLSHLNCRFAHCVRCNPWMLFFLYSIIHYVHLQFIIWCYFTRAQPISWLFLVCCNVQLILRPKWLTLRQVLIDLDRTILTWGVWWVCHVLS